MQMMNLNGSANKAPVQGVPSAASAAPTPTASAAPTKPPQAQPKDGENAILVSKELIIKLRERLAAGMGPLEELPSTRVMLDFVVSEMGDYVHGLYSVRSRTETYKWFDSEVAKKVQSMEDLKDKGRFVDACIIAYGWGEAAVRQNCVTKIVRRLPALGEDEKVHLRNIASEMDATRAKVAELRPATALAADDNA